MYMHSQIQKFLSSKVIKTLSKWSDEISKTDQGFIISLLDGAQEKELKLIQKQIEKNPHFESFYRQKIVSLKIKNTRRVEERERKREREEQGITLDF